MIYPVHTDRHTHNNNNNDLSLLSTRNKRICSIKLKANTIKCNQVQYSSSSCNRDNMVNETLQQHIALQMINKK